MTCAGRVVLAIAVIAGVSAPAAADPATARRKTTPGTVTRAASEAFADAVEADQKGDLGRALGLYRKAFEIAPHPSTIYNTADVQRRLGQLTDAITSYEIYLALAPTAPDRREVEALAAQLARTPGTLFVITVDESNPRAISLKRAYILVSGELRVKPGVEPKLEPSIRAPAIAIEVPGGKHIVDAVTSIGYGTAECEARPGERTTCVVAGPPRSDGPLVVSGPDDRLRVSIERMRSAARPEDRPRSWNRERFELPPGRTRLLLRDHRFECPALTVEVPGDIDVLYLYIEPREHEKIQRCRTRTIKQHRLRFER